MLKLTDLYYDALDAGKSGKRIEISKCLLPQKYPHFQEKKADKSYHSPSVLGLIYDTVKGYQYDNASRKDSVTTCGRSIFRMLSLSGGGGRGCGMVGGVGVAAVVAGGGQWWHPRWWPRPGWWPWMVWWSRVVMAVVAAVVDLGGSPVYKLIDSSPAPKKLSSLTITNIQVIFYGWLPGSKADCDSNQLPTIAIGAAPALSVGGTIIFFGLTSGGPYNYNGTQKWLRNFDQRLRGSIGYAICLNSLCSGENGLRLHVSKPPENAYVKQIFEGLSNVAEEVGATVGLKHKKINVSDSRVNPDNKMKQQEKKKRRLNARIKYAKFLEDTVKEMAKEVQSRRSGEPQDLDDFLDKVRTVANDEILGFAKLFNDQLTLRNISRPRLVNMCSKYMGIQPDGTYTYLRYMLHKRLQWIKNDDKMIQSKGGWKKCVSRAALFSMPVDTVGVTSLPFEDSVSERQRKLEKEEEAKKHHSVERNKDVALEEIINATAAYAQQ
nr:mitochondrial proton/calcium exchanger protein-like [Tanacetum cinerariifolium]